MFVIGFKPTYPFGLSAFGADAPPLSDYSIKDIEGSRTLDAGVAVRGLNHLATMSATAKGLEPLSQFLVTLAFQTSLLPIRVCCRNAA